MHNSEERNEKFKSSELSVKLKKCFIAIPHFLAKLCSFINVLAMSSCQIISVSFNSGAIKLGNMPSCCIFSFSTIGQIFSLSTPILNYLYSKGVGSSVGFPLWEFQSCLMRSLTWESSHFLFFHHAKQHAKSVSWSSILSYLLGNRFLMG